MATNTADKGQELGSYEVSYDVCYNWFTKLTFSLWIILVSLIISIHFFANVEATIRFLKAKLRVMQEELDRVVEECNKKVKT